MGVKVSKLRTIVGLKGIMRIRERDAPLTPKGYIPISVGLNDENKRFMVHTAALRDADFLELLCVSAEEYGFCNEGILKIRYEAKAFEDWLVKGAKQKVFRVVRPT
ncbi:unnamed protein product [Ilex paraguariensis]|uniref:Uncharacterized protein n=1 Tax=Ilex paraguariensis TaxID=185542 RepID=A0ABC8RRL4_9AQUA